MFKSGFIHWLVFWIALITFFAFARIAEAQSYTYPYYEYGRGSVEDSMRNFNEHQRWLREQETERRLRRLELEKDRVYDPRLRWDGR